MRTDPTLVICSKSPWSPAIRREHALAREAAARGYRVVFIEPPRDVRALAGSGRRRWLRAMAGRVERRRVSDGIEVIPRASLVPAHRGRLGWRLESRSLRQAIDGVANGGGALVAMLPWQWPALAALRGYRRVFDLADDWSVLIPRQREVIRDQYRRIATEADSVIVVNGEQLASLFEPRAVLEVPNGTGSELLATPPTPPPTQRVIGYAGTLSERFDAPLMASAMERLAGWKLEIYGECHYAGQGDRPAPELHELLASFPDRVVWHGSVERSGLGSRLDAARVLVVPHRRRGITGDIMKLYDYAARGRPIVSTSWGSPRSGDRPPGLRLADTGEGFAEAVPGVANEPPEAARRRREWAEARSWDRRWPAWAGAVFGEG
jgi:glycosyltransferase involved in cell wall biosynthesis